MNHSKNFRSGRSVNEFFGRRSKIAVAVEQWSRRNDAERGRWESAPKHLRRTAERDWVRKAREAEVEYAVRL